MENDDLYALVDLVHPEQLHMGDNGLTRILEGLLGHLKDLSDLLLHGNALMIPYYEQSFQGLDRLIKLDVHDNRLQTASYCTFGRFLGLRELNLDGNAWLVCNCTVWWLAQPPSRWPSSMLDCEAALMGKCDGYVVPDCQPLLSQKMMDPGSDAATAAGAANNVSVNLEMAEIIAVISILAALIAIGITGFIIWRRKRNARRSLLASGLADVILRSGNIKTARQEGRNIHTVTSSLEGFPRDSLACLHDVRISSATTDPGQTDDARNTHRVSTSESTGV